LSEQTSSSTAGSPPFRAWAPEPRCRESRHTDFGMGGRMGSYSLAAPATRGRTVWTVAAPVPR
jgi:hypothetical protein